jgi:tetratricopeptide (TPR) repeat protein
MDRGRIGRSTQTDRSAWIGIVLLSVATLLMGLYPADHEVVASIQRGDDLLAKHRYGEALPAYQSAAQRCPGSPEPHLRQFAIYVAQQRYDEAWQAYLTAIRLGGVSDETATAGVRLALAERSESLAIGTLQDMVRRRPGKGEFWVWLGQASMATGRAAEARQAFEVALGKDIGSSEQQTVHERLAVLCMDSDIPCALQHWTAAETGPDAVLSEHTTRLAAALDAVVGLEGQPSGNDERALVRAKLGEALLRYGNLALARQQFEQALELEPAYADAHAYQGYVFSLLGEEEQAAEHLERAIALRPGYTLAHYFLGMHYARVGWWVSAQESLFRAYDLDPTNPAICAAVADTYLHEDEPAYAIAERWFHAAVDNAPTDARFHLLLAHFYVDDMVDPSVRGVAVAQVAVDLAPDNSEAQETLAWAHYLAGKPDLALGPLQRAHELNPDEPRILYRLGEVYRSLGDWGQAQQYYQAAIDRDWYGPIGARARQSIIP